MKIELPFMNALLVGIVAAAIVANDVCRATDAPQTVRDVMWAWGNPEMTKPGPHTLATFAEASPAERAQLLGVPNIVMAGQGLPNDKARADTLTKEVADFKRLVWEVTPDGTGLGPQFVYKDRMAQIRTLHDQHPQIEGVLLDDMSTGKMNRGLKPEHLRHIREQLGDQYPAVKIWGAVYSMSLSRPLMNECLKEIDVISLWVWKAQDVVHMEEYVAHCERVAPGKPIVLGLYLWDYDGNRPMPLDFLKQQCETALRLAHAGRISGMVFLTINNDPKAVGWVADWIKRVGDQKLTRGAGVSPVRAAVTAAAQRESVRFTTTIPTVAGGSPWPTWIEGPDDTILMAYGAAGDGKIHMASSSDAGLSWRQITTLDYATDCGNPNYFTRLTDGSLAITVVRKEGHDSSLGWIRSHDQGCTWSEFHRILTNLPPSYAYGPIIEMDDGRWAYCPYYQDGERKFCSRFMWSPDQGRTWSEPADFPMPSDGNQGLTEATIARIGPGKFVAAIRADEGAVKSQKRDGFYLSYSQDGLKWTTPKPTAPGEIGRMPLFYRINDYWVLSYRQYVPAEKTQYSVLRLSRDGVKWSEPHRIEKDVNQAPFLVRVQGKLIALNNRYPTREILTRNVIDIRELVRQAN
jgi:hypothetical protein